MTTDLPPALARYFAAKNLHDIDGMIEQFHPDASVRDEGRTHEGTAAIRSWVEATTRKYRVTVDVVDARPDGDAWTVSGLVSGDFPGSPAMLRYRFEMADGLVAGLEIGA